jgi:hypothetical protein
MLPRTEGVCFIHSVSQYSECVYWQVLLAHHHCYCKHWTVGRQSAKGWGHQHHWPPLQHAATQPQRHRDITIWSHAVSQLAVQFDRLAHACNCPRGGAEAKRHCSNKPSATLYHAWTSHQGPGIPTQGHLAALAVNSSCAGWLASTHTLTRHQTALLALAQYG